MVTPSWRRLEDVLGARSAGGPASAEVAEPVDRYFRAALGDGWQQRSPVSAAVLEMRGQIRIGRWLPFRARQLLAPTSGTVWEARVAGVIVGSDRYVAGAGAMSWRLFGLVPIVRAEGPDVSRSSAERAAGESIWVPGAVTPTAGTRWSVEGPDRITAHLDTDGHLVDIAHRIDADGRLRSASFLRWGDPDRTGTWAEHPFGVEVSEHRRFGDVAIASAGTAGWHHGTDRWDEGAFFRFEITRWRSWPAPST